MVVKSQKKCKVITCKKHAKEIEKNKNLLLYKLPYTDKKINKGLIEYFERKYNKQKYGYPFLKCELKSNFMQISTKVRQGSKNKNRSSFAYW